MIWQDVRIIEQLASLRDTRLHEGAVFQVLSVYLWTLKPCVKGHTIYRCSAQTTYWMCPSFPSLQTLLAVVRKLLQSREAIGAGDASEPALRFRSEAAVCSVPSCTSAFECSDDSSAVQVMGTPVFLQRIKMSELSALSMRENVYMLLP